MGDYVRQMPNQGSFDMARPPSLAMRAHIDVPLLLLLMLLYIAAAPLLWGYVVLSFLDFGGPGAEKP